MQNMFNILFDSTNVFSGQVGFYFACHVIFSHMNIRVGIKCEKCMFFKIIVVVWYLKH